jgi:hypothetical protein
MPVAIKGSFPSAFRLAFELRYRFGFTYLDRCGRTINLIMRDHPEWILLNQLNPQNAPLVSTRNGCRFNFSAARLDLGLQKPMGEGSLSSEDFMVFQEQVEQLVPLIIDQLSLEDFSRIGCRIWYLFPFDQMRQAEAWLKDLGCFSVSERFSGAFDGTLEGVNFTVVLASLDRKFRIGFDTVERTVPIDLGDSVMAISTHQLPSELKEEKGQPRHQRTNPRFEALLAKAKAKKLAAENAAYAAMIDVDASQDEPEVVRAGEFVRTTLDQALDRLRKAIE